MNIWIFNHYALTPDLPGGTRHFDFARELTNRGHKVTIFASSFHYSLLKETKKYDKNKFILEIYDNVNFIWIKTFPYKKNDWKRVLNMLSYSYRSYKVAKNYKKIDIDKPDVIIGSSVHLFAVYIAYKLSKFFKVPFVMEVRDLWPQTLIDMGISKWHPFIILLGILEKFLYKQAKRIITLLPKAKDYITSLGVSEDKIVWIPNGVYINRFSSNRLKNKNTKKFIVTYAGAIGKANNLDVLIKAAKILKDVSDIEFIIVGDGPERRRLEKKVFELGLNNVQFKGSVSKNEVLFYLCNSDILYFNLKKSPVFKYGISSNKLFDYLASGKPVIFAASAGNNPVADARAGITVPPENPEALAEAILKLYRMPKEERQEMGERGRKYVEKYYSIPKLVDKLEKVLYEVINDSQHTS